MDSYDKIQRMNQLTKDLKQHGFAESSFEAIQQANQIYGNDNVDHDVQHGMIKDKENSESGFGDKKIVKLSGDIETLTGKINEIIRAINELDTRMAELKTKHDKMSNMMVEAAKVEQRRETNVETKSELYEEAKQQSPSQPTNHTPETKSQDNGKPKDEYSMNQRTGNYNPQDVAIDKMFYYGKK